MSCRFSFLLATSCTQSVTVTLTCIVADVIGGINPTDLGSFQDVWIPRLAIDWIMDNVIQSGKLYITVDATYLNKSKTQN